ncbi:MAG: sigma-70 family RNA polymerase sigma factor [Acidobacteria bacterium]|nr:sigma-70 family RNA polymerase sigma factor [Acidobacteriota bacterium]
MRQTVRDAVPGAASHSDEFLAGALKRLLARGHAAEARERYGELVRRHQGRASRIAYGLLRDAAEADEAVQDAFVKAYSHIATFREDLSFEAWLTRILVNGCRDRLKSRTRRQRWLVTMTHPLEEQSARVLRATSKSPEELLLQQERHARLARALTELPERQRTVFVLTHQDGRTAREVSELTGLNESTVRGHLFRAVRQLRAMLGHEAQPSGRSTRAPMTAARGFLPEPAD